jgi:hypothetical protein
MYLFIMFTTLDQDLTNLIHKTQRKLDPPATKSLFIRYCQTQKGYCCYSPVLDDALLVLILPYLSPNPPFQILNLMRSLSLTFLSLLFFLYTLLTDSLFYSLLYLNIIFQLFLLLLIKKIIFIVLSLSLSLSL